jgi:hypothetical protein
MDHTAAREGQTVLECTNTFHTLRTKMGMKDLEWHLVLKYCGALHRYIQTEMDFLNIFHWELHINILSKSSRNLGTKTNGSMGLQIRNNQSMVKTTLTNSLSTTSPRHKKRRGKERLRMTLGSGANST